jgi:multiple sugar transport system permease protein
VILPLLRAAAGTVLLLTTGAAWNDFFPPPAVPSDPDLLPVTVGIRNGQALSNAGGRWRAVWKRIVTGSFNPVVPLVPAFPSLQKYRQGGLPLAAGGERTTQDDGSRIQELTVSMP